jgi:hypothetical protein
LRLLLRLSVRESRESKKSLAKLKSSDMKGLKLSAKGKRQSPSKSNANKKSFKDSARPKSRDKESSVKRS